MAGMTTVLTPFSDNGNARTSTVPTHTAIKPKLVIEKRRVPEGNQIVSEYTAKVVYATVDAAGLVLSNKVSFEATVRYPVAGLAADISAALVVFRDMIASDDFTNSVNTQGWL